MMNSYSPAEENYLLVVRVAEVYRRLFINVVVVYNNPASLSAVLIGLKRYHNPALLRKATRGIIKRRKNSLINTLIMFTFCTSQ